MVTSRATSTDKAVELCYYLIAIKLINAVAEAVVSKITLTDATLKKSAKPVCCIYIVVCGGFGSDSQAKSHNKDAV
jgi:hypothetical protein